MVAVDSTQEAFYLASVLNSLPFNLAAISYSQTGGKSFASPHILGRIRVPKFDRKIPYCDMLCTLGEKARKAAAKGAAAELQKVSAQINQAVLEIWGLTQSDLKEIEAGYAEITKADLETDEEEEETEAELVEKD